MRLTTKGRYAVAAMADIAVTAVEGPTPVAEIALRQGLSVAHLEKILIRLRRAGLIESIRGVAGGYRLARPASDIRISQIVSAADEEIRTTACEPGAAHGCRGGTVRCLTHDLWDELGRQIEIFLNAITLQDVISRRVLGVAGVNAPAAQVDGGTGQQDVLAAEASA